MGVRTVMLARYEITNISDDKPKFVVKRLRSVLDGDFMRDRQAPRVELRVGSVQFEVADIITGEAQPKRFGFSFKTSIPVETPYRTYLDYDPELGLALNVHRSFRVDPCIGKRLQEQLGESCLALLGLEGPDDDGLVGRNVPDHCHNVA